MDPLTQRLFQNCALPKVIISLNNLDGTFAQRAFKVLNLQIVDGRTYAIWRIIVESILYQVVDKYTGSFRDFLAGIQTLPDLRDFDREELLDYIPGLRSTAFTTEVRLLAVQLGLLLRNSVPCELETYDIFFDKYWEGSLVLSVFHKSLTHDF